MNRSLLASLFILASGLLPLQRANAGDSSLPSFAVIQHFALLNRSIRFDSAAQIERTWESRYDELYIVEIRHTRNRYLLGVDNEHGVQEIAIRGTTNLENAAYDVRFLKSRNVLLGIHLFRGFEMMAEALERNVKPYLRSDYSVRISGQSLGAAEALILAMMLERQGYRIEQIITFGQPKVTDAAGANAFARLPLVRVVDENDIVPLLPPARLVYRENPYVHFGKEIMLLSGNRYCIAGQDVANGPVPDSVLDHVLSKKEIDSLLAEHSIKTYVESIARKLDGALLVGCPEPPAVGYPTAER